MPLNIQYPSAGRALMQAEQIRGARSQNTLRDLQVQDYGEDRGFLKKQRARTEEQWKFQDETQALDYLMKEAPLINFENYPESRDYLIGKGLNPAILPEPQEMLDQAMQAGVMPAQYFESWKNQALVSLKDRTAAFKAQTGRITAEAKTGAEKWSAPKAGVDEKGKRVFFQTNQAGQSRVVPGVGPEPKKGMKIYDRDGNLLVDTGGGDVTPKTKGVIEAKIVGGKEQIARMQAIQAEFKPEFQEIGTRLGAAWTGLKAKLGRDVSKADSDSLIAFKKYQRKAIENINLYIKELTGAQMSEKEADRLRLAQPDPGENWWQGDDPITFKAKMDDVIKMARASVARFEFYRSQGLSEAKIRKMVKDGTAAPLEEIASRLK